MPFFLALKADALYLADRASEALKAMEEIQLFGKSSGAVSWCAELYRLRGVFLTALGAEETQIEASFREAIRIAREQKSISLRNAPKEPTQNFAGKKQVGKWDVDSGYLFANSSGSLLKQPRMV